MTQSLSDASVHIVGAWTYLEMSAHWHRIPKAVFSRSLTGHDTERGPVDICGGGCGLDGAWSGPRR